jgi:chemotaxis receptor (MCP) glutamine deamidase CheD
MAMQADGIQPVMSATREIIVAPDRFEVAAIDATLVAELQSAIAVCVYDAVEEAGALLHLRCIVRSPKPIDMTDSTLATELLLLDRCVESMREAMPAARNLQARVVAHLADHPRAQETCDTVLTMVQHFLTDAGMKVSPVDISSGPPRTLRFRPSMGWLQTR